MIFDYKLKKRFETSRLNNFDDYDYGWIFPDGSFYGCDYAEHEMIAELHFNYNYNEFENLGVIRLMSEEPFANFLKKPTKAQIDTVCYFFEKKDAIYALKLFYKEIEDY